MTYLTKVEGGDVAKETLNVVWFKRDLRVSDHAPLAKAARDGKILALYIFEPDLWRQPDLSYRHFAYLVEALQDLDSQLKEIDTDLVVKVGNAVSILQELAKKFRIKKLFAHQETWNLWTYKRDNAVRAWAKDNGTEFSESPNNGIVRNIDSRDGWSHKWHATMSTPIVSKPKILQSVGLKSDALPTARNLNLFINQPLSSQKATRSAASATLNSFLYSRGHNYKFEMSSPITAEKSCSRISPYLAFGQISIKEAYQITEKRIRELRGVDTRYIKSLKSFLSRLRWHCHFMQKLEDQPNIETKALHSSFENLRPSFYVKKHLRAWENGITGYPMIDACMRYLNATGWINFRMRAMLVSFASYHLWLDWRLTAPHLARQFLDYEPGIHYSQIQMQSGTTGMNSIRIYNPIKQGLDQDPDGKFIRKWVPELKDIPNQFIHQPWLLEDRNLNYPKPIVDEKLARTAAKEKIYYIKKQIKNSVETESLVKKHASRLNRGPGRKLKPIIPLKKQLTLGL